jgi:hypothetical protein
MADIQMAREKLFFFHFEKGVLDGSLASLLKKHLRMLWEWGKSP